jgi:hypothetical protein
MAGNVVMDLVSQKIALELRWTLRQQSIHHEHALLHNTTIRWAMLHPNLKERNKGY